MIEKKSRNNSESNHNPFISIIIPIHNDAEFMQQSIGSVIGQTFSNIEIICVDDCSTDESVAIINEYAKTDKRIRLLCLERNMGPLKARSTGVLAATGRYIMFLDGDDELELFACEKMHSIAKLHKADIYGFSIALEGPYDIRKGKRQGKIRSYNGYVYGTDIIKKSAYNEVITWSITDKMFAREPCKKAHELIGDWHIGFKLIPKGEDALEFLATAYFSETFFGTDIALYKYHLFNGFSNKQLYTLEEFEHFCTTAISKQQCRDFFLMQGEMDKYEEVVNSYSKEWLILSCNRFLDKLAEKDKAGALKIIMSYWPHSDVVECLGKIANDANRARKMKRWEVPFKLLPKDGRIVLYGAGDMGNDYQSQLTDSGFCKIALWVDKGYKDISHSDKKVSTPEEIANIDFDVILVAVLDKEVASSIRQYLVDSLNISESQIVWHDPSVVEG